MLGLKFTPRRKSIENVEAQPRLVPTELQEKDVPNNNENHSLDEDGISITMSGILENQVHRNLPDDLLGLETLLQQRFSVLVHPENNLPVLQDLIRAVKKTQVSRRVCSSGTPR